VEILFIFPEEENKKIATESGKKLLKKNIMKKA
jgi:hypothetical protein